MEPDPEVPVFEVGQRFRRLDTKYRYIVYKVDEEGGICCYDENETEKRHIGRTVHIFCRTPFEAIWKRGEFKVTE